MEGVKSLVEVFLQGSDMGKEGDLARRLFGTKRACEKGG
jgi:hypothetical protein